MGQLQFTKPAQVERRQRAVPGYGQGYGALVERRRTPFRYPHAQDCNPRPITHQLLARTAENQLAADEAAQPTSTASEELFRILSDFQESERRRVASDLHDSIGASLTVVKFRLEETIGRLGDHIPASELQCLRDASSAIKHTMEEVRRIAMNLKPAILDDLGLIPAMNWYCRELASCHPALQIEKSIRISETDIPGSLKTTIFRILQEAANNTIKHSGASLLRVTLTHAGSAIRLSVEDNGSGFDPTAKHCTDGQVHCGATGMRQRVKCSGGNLTIASSPGAGTRITADWAVRTV